MRRSILLLLLSAALSQAACGKCRTSSDCAAAQHCEFVSGECLDGCMRDSDCSAVARCDSSSGRCVPTGNGLPDVGTTTTSTIPDAG